MSAYLSVARGNNFPRKDNGAPVALQSYWDDSETEHFCTMAGHVAPVQKWESFNSAWSAVLSEYRVSKLHMTDFVSRYGEFKAWGEPKRREFLSDLIDVIRTADMFAISASVHIEALKTANAKWKFDFTPYSVAAALTMYSYSFSSALKNEVCVCLLDRPTDRKFQLGRAENILRRDPLVKNWWEQKFVKWRHLTTAEKMQMATETLRGIEAADFSAWEQRAYAEAYFGLVDRKGGHWSGCRASLIELGRASAGANGLLADDAFLDALFERITTGSPITAPSP